MNNLIKGVIADIQATAIRDKATILTIPYSTDAHILFADGSHSQITIEVPRQHSLDSIDSVAQYARWCSLEEAPAVFVDPKQIVVVNNWEDDSSTRSNIATMQLSNNEQFKMIIRWDGEDIEHSMFGQKQLQKMFRTKLRDMVDPETRTRWISLLSKIVTTSGIDQGERSLGSKSSGGEWPESFTLSCRVIDEPSLEKLPRHKVEVVLDVEVQPDGARIFLTALPGDLKRAIDAETQTLVSQLESQLQDSNIPIYRGRP